MALKLREGWLKLALLIRFLFLLAGILVAMPALGVECDFSDRTKLHLMSASDFFEKTEVGAIALAEGCNTSTNICDGYLPISQCEVVDYRFDEMDSRHPIFFALNSRDECGTQVSCGARSSFVAATVGFPANVRVKPFVDLSRNNSRDWQPAGGNKQASEKCCDPPPLADGEISEFVDFHRNGASTRADYVKAFPAPQKFWHTTFVDSTGKIVQTVNQRSFIAEAFEPGNCGGEGICSVKAYLYRFTETEGNRPSTPLLFRAYTMIFSKIVVRTTVPGAGQVYDWQKQINLLRD